MRERLCDDDNPEAFEGSETARVTRLTCAADGLSFNACVAVMETPGACPSERGGTLVLCEDYFTLGRRQRVTDMQFIMIIIVAGWVGLVGEVGGRVLSQKRRKKKNFFYLNT